MRKVSAFEDSTGTLHRNERDCLIADLAALIEKASMPTSPPLALACGIADNLPQFWTVLTVLNEPRNQKAALTNPTPQTDALAAERPDADHPVPNLDGDFIGYVDDVVTSNGLPNQSLDPADLRIGQRVEVMIEGDDGPTIGDVVIKNIDRDDSVIGVDGGDGYTFWLPIPNAQRIIEQPEDRMTLEDAGEALKNLENELELQEGPPSPNQIKSRILLNRRIDRLTTENEA